MGAPAPLLERDQELAALAGLLDGAAAGRGGLALIDGEAGAGKTSLLDAAARQADQRELRVLRARGGEYERDFTYGVVRQLFEPALAGAEAGRGPLSGTAAMARPLFEPDPGAAVAADPLAVQHGLYWLLADLAETRPLLLVVDDAHWADPASLQALLYIARRLDGIATALVLGVRSGEAEADGPLLAELRLLPGARTIAPGELSATATAELACRELGKEPSAGFAASCHRAAAGNPFLLIELLRAIVGEGIEPVDAHADRLEEIAAAGVSSSILNRLGRLGETAVEIARAVAILEPNADPENVAALVGTPLAEIAAACDRMIAAGLLADQTPLAFVHPLVRQAVYTDVHEPRRAVLHEAAARALIARGAPVDSVAAHLLLTRPAGERWVVEALRGAAAESHARGAPRGAAGYLRRALTEPPAAPEGAAIRRQLGTALLDAGDHEGIELLIEVRAGSADPALRAEIAGEVSYPLSARGESERAAALLAESISEVGGAAAPAAWMLRAWSLFQFTLGREDVPAEAVTGSDDGLNGSTVAERQLLIQSAGMLAAGRGSMRLAVELAERGLGDQRTIEADAMLGLPGSVAAVALVLADRGERVAPMFDFWVESARRRGVINSVGVGLWVKSLANLVDGDLGAATVDAEAAIDMVHSGLVTPRASAAGSLARAQVERGDLEAGAAMLARFGDAEPPRGFPGALMLCGRGALRAAEGRHAEARLDYLEAGERVAWLPLANEELIGWRLGLAEAEAALGNAEEARRLAEEALAAAREAGGRRGIGIALRERGKYTRELGDLREAAELLAATRARLQYARALVELGAALRRGNSRREAREPLRAGLDLAHRCGAAPLEARARTELEASGARPRRALRSGVDSLTPSELRVARLAVTGMTNREIAQSLFVSSKTVETHLRHAYAKLGITGRAELAPALV